MELHTLKPIFGSLKNKKRIGRGQGSGKGGTSTRGHNGAQSRSGYKQKIGFEGGQQPLQRRIPMYGFKCPSRINFTIFNLDTLQNLAHKYQVSTIDHFFLRKHSIIGKNDKYKILADGKLTLKISVTAHRYSASALKAIQDLGGKVTILSIHE